MSTLQLEWDRLYRANPPDSHHPADIAAGLIAQDGRVRAMVLELARPADWDVVSRVWRGVQTDMALPAPAIAVTGVDAYQLWFSLAEPVHVSQAQTFLQNLRSRYLGGIAPGRIGMLPFTDASGAGTIRHANRVPELKATSGHWSSFVAPDLAAIFSEEPWLDIPPGDEAQASVLSRLESIKPAVFHTILDSIQPGAGTEKAPDEPVRRAVLQSKPLDARQFLTDIMNDEGIALHLRIEAAKALLP